MNMTLLETILEPICHSIDVIEASEDKYIRMWLKDENNTPLCIHVDDREWLKVLREGHKTPRPFINMIGRIVANHLTGEGEYLKNGGSKEYLDHVLDYIKCDLGVQLITQRKTLK